MKVTSRIESLPSELLFLILDDLSSDQKDGVAFGMSCERIWSHMLQHIESDCESRWDSIAGVEIACTGTCPEDFPASFYRNELLSSTPRYSGGYSGEAFWTNNSAGREYSAVSDDPEDSWFTACNSLDYRAAGIHTASAVRMAKEFATACFVALDSSLEDLHILRNLTTKEYVRFRRQIGTKGNRAYVEHPDVDQLRLDDLLLLRISWAGASHSQELEKLGVRRGVWAGHCFDIIPFNHDAVVSEHEDWQDSTDEVVKQAIEVADRIIPPALLASHPVLKLKRWRKRRINGEENFSIVVNSQ
jgi:hypothetical protein